MRKACHFRNEVLERLGVVRLSCDFFVLAHIVFKALLAVGEKVSTSDKLQTEIPFFLWSRRLPLLSLKPNFRSLSVSAVIAYTRQLQCYFCGDYALY